MSMRAQLSLLFDDENLFDNFVIPYKNEKLLNSIIIKCLSAYYYNEEVRNLIEGTNLDEVSDSEEVTSTQSLVDGIRASLIMQDFLASELQNTIDAGTEDVSNILNRTNDVAEQTGVAKTTTTEYGASVLKIEQHNLDLSGQQPKQQGTTEASQSNDTLKILLMAVTKLAEASGNSEVVNLLHSSPAESQSTTTTESSETESSAPNQEVLMTETRQESVSTAEVPVPTSSYEVEEDFVEEVSVPVKNDFESTPVVEKPVETLSPDVGVVTTSEANANIDEDASDAIGELLGSLF